MSNGPFLIVFERHALRDLKALHKDDRLQILQETQKYLSAEPFQPIKTRIKKMSGFSPALYRLRIGDYRAYYRIHQQRVVVLAVLHKKDADKWLRRL